MRALVTVNLDGEDVEAGVQRAAPLLERLAAQVDLLYVAPPTPPMVLDVRNPELGPLLEAAVERRILPYVDEHYWLPLYGQAGLTSGALGTAPTAGNQGRIGALRKPLPCWSLFTEGHITWDGRLSACCFDHDGRFHMGDLTRQSFAEAWHSAPFRRLRAANLAEDVRGTPCEKCIAYD